MWMYNTTSLIVYTLHTCYCAYRPHKNIRLLKDSKNKSLKQVNCVSTNCCYTHFIRCNISKILSLWLCNFHSRPGVSNLFGKGPQLLLWTRSRAAHVKITVYGTPDRLNRNIIRIMEFCYKNATLLCYVTCLNKRKHCLDKNLKHKSISLSLSRCSLSRPRCTSKWVGRVDLF
jgi:hypothetical protein